MDKYYTVEEIAEALKMSTATILRYIRNKKIVAVKIGRGYRITEADFKAFLAKNA